MLFVVGNYFLFGCVILTCCSLWIIGAVPLMRLLMTAVVNFVLFWILTKCLNWGHNGSGEEQEEEEEDDDIRFLF
jgi:hypothetical protein